MKHLDKSSTISASRFSTQAAFSTVFLLFFAWTHLAWAQESSFSKIFEAEKAVTSGALVKSNQAGYTCSGYVEFQNIRNDYVEWQIVVPSGGEYTAVFQYAFGGSGAGPLKVEVNEFVSGNLYPFFSTGSWSAWQTNSLGVVLRAGVNYLRLTSNGYATPTLDHVKIVKNGTSPDTTPTSDCGEPFSRYIEAETASISGAIVANTHSGYAYKGYVDFQNPSNDYIEWEFILPAAGWYSYEFKYAYSGSGARPVRIDINGNTIASYYPFYAGGTWDTWQIASLGSTFDAGRNTIRLTAVGSSGPNIDNLWVYQSASDAASAAKPAETMASPYPNPAVDRLHIKLNRNFEGAKIRLFSSMGVETKASLLRRDAEDAVLDVSGVKPGVYHLQIQKGEAIEIKRIRIK